mmetsp:Transcript_15141/g.25800  ORF Transcript_15141/g.25800 Transcript_15141/m.25800 type:complete len:222 (-) Transcript_15141:35-700(-)
MAICSVSSARKGFPTRTRRAKLCSASWHSTEVRARCVMNFVPQMKISEVALVSPLVIARHSSHLSTFRCRSKLAFFTRCLAKLQSKRSETSPEASWKARTKSLVLSFASLASSRFRKPSTFFLAAWSMPLVGSRPALPGIRALRRGCLNFCMTTKTCAGVINFVGSTSANASATSVSERAMAWSVTSNLLLSFLGPRKALRLEPVGFAFGALPIDASLFVR